MKAWFKKLGLINQAPTKNSGFLPLFNTVEPCRNENVYNPVT